MNINDEIKIIGPGFRRFSDDGIRKGYWTPELARWSDKNSFEQKISLQSFNYVDGLKVTGVIVNACPLVCILESEVAANDLTVEITGNTGIPSGYIVSGDETITGFSKDHQYGVDIYRREWVTGGEVFQHSFTIPAHALPGKTYLMPNKRIYEVTSVKVSPRETIFPLTDIKFYGLADNGSKILYSFNWNKTYEDLKSILYSRFAAPKRCPSCYGSGVISGLSCSQCNGYKYSGWNSTGYMFEQIANEVGVVPNKEDSFEVYQDKVWAMKSWVTPTKKEVKRYFSHFARIEEDEVEIRLTNRNTSTSGVESIVEIMLPFTIPLSRFSVDDSIWREMASSIEPAGVMVNFSFVVSGFQDGSIIIKELSSSEADFYSGAVYYSGVSGDVTGELKDDWEFGFYEPFDFFQPVSQRNWYCGWNTKWGFSNFVSGGASGDDAVSGYAVISGDTYTWISGLLEGTAWVKLVEPSFTLVNDTVWTTGEGTELTQAELWNSGTYYYDNFWSSGEETIIAGETIPAIQY